MADVGMEMRVMGSPTYYPLIEAGNNWYDSKARNDAARYSVASGQDYQITTGITVCLICRM